MKTKKQGAGRILEDKKVEKAKCWEVFGEDRDVHWLWGQNLMEHPHIRGVRRRIFT
jgi:hypothetical protein